MRVRSAFATLPLRPITLPMSPSATCSSMIVPSSSRTSSTRTASGSSTSERATYSTSSFAPIAALLPGGQHARHLEQPLDGVGRLGALREPRLRALDVDLELDGLRPRVVVPDRLDRATVARVAGIRDDDTVRRLLLRPDAREPDPNGHPGAIPPSWPGTSVPG